MTMPRYSFTTYGFELDHLPSKEDYEEDMVRAFGWEEPASCMVQKFGWRDKRVYPKFWRDPLGCKDFQPENLKVCGPRFLVAVFYFVFCVYVNNWSQAWLQDNISGFYESEWQLSPATFSASQEWLKEHDPQAFQDRWRNEKPQARPAAPTRKYYQNRTVILWDVGFLFLPPISMVTKPVESVFGSKVEDSGPADFFAGASFYGAIFRFVIVPGPMSMRWVFLKRALVVWGTIFLYRAFTILLTPLPNPYDHCIPKMTFRHNPWAEAFALYPFSGTLFGAQSTCQDVMFSGHTAMGTVFSLFFMGYIGKGPWFASTGEGHCVRISLKVVAWSWLLFGWYVIAASHFHYSVDVLVGVLITLHVYGGYHKHVKSVWVIRSDIPTVRFIRWFEAYSPDVMFWRCQLERKRTTKNGPSESEDVSTSSFSSS